jgi:hypothetical protein
MQLGIKALIFNALGCDESFFVFLVHPVFCALEAEDHIQKCPPPAGAGIP